MHRLAKPHFLSGFGATLKTAIFILARGPRKGALSAEIEWAKTTRQIAYVARKPIPS